MGPRHEPVLLRETLALLRNGPGLYLDATLGDGGHAHALLGAEPGARLLGCDRDLDALAFARGRLAPFGDRVMLRHARFRELPGAHAAAGGEPLAGALFDFGLSSRQIDDPARGMSFMSDGPLDLRMDASRGETAAARLAAVEPAELAGILREYGDVREAGRLARALVEAARAGHLQRTRDAADVVRRVLGTDHPRRLAPVFQALRVWVNGEMEDLEAAMAWLPDAMADGGVVVTLAYHSGEDRRVKQSLGARPDPASRRLPPGPGEAGGDGPWDVLTRRVVVPSEDEQQRNPRARSARLRAFRRKPR
jgi:16S rRNA (cytosine1402-N4)-methyltransferase